MKRTLALLAAAAAAVTLALPATAQEGTLKKIKESGSITIGHRDASLPFSYYDNAKVGSLMSRITSDLFDVTEFAHHCPEEFFIAGIKIVASFCILCTMNVWLTLIIFAVIPPMRCNCRNRRSKSRGTIDFAPRRPSRRSACWPS